MNLASVSEVRSLLPKHNGKSPDTTTIRRWITRGVNGVRLNATRVGKLWFTSPEWIEEFQRRCTEAALNPQQVVKRCSPKEHQKRMKLAREVLLNRWGIDLENETKTEKAASPESDSRGNRRSARV